MHEVLKQALGVANAKCSACAYLGDDSDDPYSGPCHICENPKKRGVDNLKSFPFKKDMSCWKPEFWCTNLPGQLLSGKDPDAELDRLYAEFHKIIEDHSRTVAESEGA